VVALIVLILLLLLLGGGGLLAPALHVLWIVLVVGLILWAIGFFVRGAEGSRWWRWGRALATAGAFFFLGKNLRNVGGLSPTTVR
jgi:hypothetical protein